MTVYANLFHSLSVKGMTLRNRISMSPMGTNFALANGEISSEHIDYYTLRAKGGVGLIIVENSNVDYPLGANGTTQLRIDKDCFIPSLYRLCEKVHGFGACIALQINHAGSAAISSRIGGQPVSASNIPYKKGGEIPHSLCKAEIESIVQKYAYAAKRAQIAGFDAVHIHGGHSYLINQFLCPLTNNRSDEFGGSPENRARFASMVVQAVREEVGPTYPIMMRVNIGDMLEGGNSEEESLELLKYFVTEIDIVDVSVGLQDSIHYQIDIARLPDGWKSSRAKAVKEKYGKVVVTVGNIRTPEVADDILAKGDADIISIGRGLLADPDWSAKARDGKASEIRQCISCNIGCIAHRGILNRPIRCTVNPELYQESSINARMITYSCNVAVVGGGVAGLEAACTAAEAGCSVTLFEKRNVLGGIMEQVTHLPCKKRIRHFLDYLIQRAKNLDNLNIVKGKEVSYEQIVHYNPDIIVNATGSSPLLPLIEGLHEGLAKENGRLATVLQMIERIPNYPVDMQDMSIVIIGGGAVGLDVAEFFTSRNARVTIIEMLSEIGKDLDPVSQCSINEMIRMYNIKVMTNTMLTKVCDEIFIVSDETGEFALPFDLGFICIGMKANTDQLPMLERYCNDKRAVLYNIGDSRRARKMIDSVREGHDILCLLESGDFAREE